MKGVVDASIRRRVLIALFYELGLRHYKQHTQLLTCDGATFNFTPFCCIFGAILFCFKLFCASF